MGSTIRFRRRRPTAVRLVALSFAAGAVVVLFVVFGSGGGEDEPPPLSRRAAPDEAAPAEDPQQEPGRAFSRPEPEQAGPPAGGADDPGEPEGPPQDLVVAAEARLEALRSAGDLEGLRRELARLVLDSRHPARQRSRWLETLDGLNRRLVFSAASCAGFERERIRPGDTYTHVAGRVRKRTGTPVTSGLLEAINRVPPRRLRAGRTLKVPTEPLTVLVRKSEFRLYVLLGEVPVLHFPIGLGRNGSTPEGAFTVGGKAKNPTWTDPETGRRYRYGEEGHRVGSRWMRFYRDGTPTSYGIHGTNEPESIGRAESAGCIRLRNEDVERLYDLVPDGARVVVTS